MAERVLRIVTFRPLHGAFDQVVRGELVPELARMPGLEDVYSARQGPDDTGSRILATVWRSRDAMADAVGESLGRFRPEYVSEVTDRRLQIVRLLVGRRYLPDARPSILRVVRGRARPGELEGYAADVRRGSDEDASREDGPVAIYMGAPEGADPDAFVTLSAWRCWEHVESATGGDVHRPQVTRRAEHLLDWEAEHFEVVPDP